MNIKVVLNVVDLAWRAETVEVRARSARVGTNGGREEPLSNVEFGERLTLHHAIERITSGAKEGGFEDLARLLVLLEREELGVEVVENDRVEVAVDTVAKVILHGLNVLTIFSHLSVGTTSVDLESLESHGSDEVASRFSDDGDLFREVLLEAFGNNGGNLSERDVRVGTREPTTNVNEGEIEANLAGSLKKLRNDGESVLVGGSRHAATPNVEGDTDKVQFELLARLDQGKCVREGSSELERERHLGILVERGDAKDNLSLREENLDLLQLIEIIERHQTNSVLLGSSEVLERFSRVSVDELRRLGTSSECKVEFVLAGTVEENTQIVENAKNDRVRVALHGVVWLYARKVVAKEERLLHDRGNVHVHKRILSRVLEVQGGIHITKGTFSVQAEEVNLREVFHRAIIRVLNQLSDTGGVVRNIVGESRGIRWANSVFLLLAKKGLGLGSGGQGVRGGLRVSSEQGKQKVKKNREKKDDAREINVPHQRYDCCTQSFRLIAISAVRECHDAEKEVEGAVGGNGRQRSVEVLH